MNEITVLYTSGAHFFQPIATNIFLKTPCATRLQLITHIYMAVQGQHCIKTKNDYA